MNRIFLTLSLVVVGLLLVCNIHGLLGGDYNRAWREGLQRQALQSDVADARSPDNRSAAESHQQFLKIQGDARLHTLLGLFSALIAVLLNCLSATYFIGTGRWCKEVCVAYALPESLVQDSTRLKRKCFPWSLLGILTTLGMAALGAASDPGTMLKHTQDWVLPHRYFSFVGTALIAWALAWQVQFIRQNQVLIQRIVQQVREIREAKGLPV
jgi:hypothetical protein